MSILIAENSIPSRVLLKTIIFSMNMELEEVSSGIEVWNRLQSKNPPKILIIDIDLPDMSGIELVRKIRDQETKTDSYSYIIMVSSIKQKTSIKLDTELKVDNFLTTPIDRHTLFTSLKVAGRIINQQMYLYNIQRNLEQQLTKQKEQIEKAQKIQQILNTCKLPQPATVNLEAVYNPSQELGGDFFNIIKTPHNNLAIIMVDCTGHGLEASMYATLLKSICDRHKKLLDNPEFLVNFVQMVNTDVADYIISDQYPVMFVSVYCPENRKYYYSSANGEHPYLIRNKKAIKVEKTLGMHLGYNTEWEYKVKSFLVEDGDIIFLHSDAIIEIEDAPWSRENDELLTRVLTGKVTNINDLNRQVMTFIDNQVGGTTLADDLSLIYLEIKDPYCAKSCISSIPQIEKELSELQIKLTSFNYQQKEIDEILVVYTELLLNSLIHGNKNNTQLLVNITKNINCKSINIKIEDAGTGFDSTKRGYGLTIVEKLSDRLSYSNNGSTVTITKNKKRVKTYNNYKVSVNLFSKSVN